MDSIQSFRSSQSYPLSFNSGGKQFSKSSRIPYIVSNAVSSGPNLYTICVFTRLFFFSATAKYTYRLSFAKTNFKNPEFDSSKNAPFGFPYPFLLYTSKENKRFCRINLRGVSFFALKIQDHTHHHNIYYTGCSSNFAITYTNSLPLNGNRLKK